MWMQGGVEEGERLDAEAAKHLLRRAGQMLRPYRRQCVVALVMVVVWTGTTLAGPFLVKYGIDQGIKADDGGALNAAVVGYVVVAGISYVAYRFQVLLISRIGESFLRDLRLRVFDHLQRLSMPFYDREKAGIIVSRMTSDVDSLQELVQMGLLMFVSNGLLLVVSVIVLAIVSWELLLLCMICVPFVVLASIRFQRESNAAYLDVRDGIGDTLSQLQEGIAGVRVVQAFGREDVESARFQLGNRRLFDAHMRSVKISAWYLPVIELAGLLTTAIAVGIGGWWVHTGELTVGTVTFFILTLSNLFEPIQQLSQLFNIVQSAAAALSKLFNLLDTPVDVPERKGAVDLPARGDIVVEGVGFAYVADKPVLTGVDLTIPVGARIALVGPTGAGKSTLAKLIARLYDPTEGSIRYAGTDLRDATLRSLAGSRRGGAPGGLPLQRHDPRQRPAGPPGRHRRGGRGGPRDDRGPRALRPAPRGPPHRGPRAGLAAVRGGEAARVAGPGRARRSRPSSCSTRPPPASTPAPSWWSSTPWSS